MKRTRIATQFAILSGMCAATAVAGAADAPAAPGDTLEEVVVTGSRLQAAGFTAPTPVTVVGAEVIEQRAPMNVSDVLLEQPALQIANTSASRNGSGNNASNPLQQGFQATPNLRSLGALRTLTLINSKRSVVSSWGGSVDINLVPVGLVERIDTVTGGASAAYGSDAVAGVVNVILRNKMQGIKAGVQMGLTDYKQAKSYTYNLAGGTSFMDGRVHLIGGLDFNKTASLTDLSGKQFAQDEIGTVSPTAAQRAAGNLPATLITTGVEPASTAPGGLFVAANGQAYTFDNNGNPVPFSRGTLYNCAGTSTTNCQFMTGSTSNAGHNLNNQAPLSLREQRTNAMGRVSFDLTDSVSTFAELYNSRYITYPYRAAELQQGQGFGATAPAITVAANNPFVTPATLALLGTATTFTIGRNDTEFGFQGKSGNAARLDNETRRIVAGFEGSFGDGWKWDTYYQTGTTWSLLERNDYSAFALQKAVNGCGTQTATSPGFSAINLTLVNLYEQLSGKTCVPFNPFGVGRNSQAALDYVQNYTWQRQHMWLDVAAFNVSGSPFKLPAGDVAVAAGAEWRQEKLAADSDPVSRAGTGPFGGVLANNLVESHGETSVREVFVEAGLPLLRDRPGVRSLDLNAAGRVTRYELSGTVRTWKYGVTWEPLDSLRVRFTKSHDIRAPNLMAMFFTGGPNATNVNTLLLPVGTVGLNGTVYNPPGNTAAVGQVANNSSASSALSILVPGGSGNPALRPETADTVTGGVVFTLGGFQSSADYYYINLTNQIAGPGAQQSIDFCIAGDRTYCDFITFNSAVAGGIQLLNPLQLNLNRTAVKGMDFEVGYRMRLGSGNFSVRALANYQPHNEAINRFTGQTTDSANTLGSQPKLAYNLSLGYDVGRWGTNVQIRGFSQRRGNNIVYNPDGSVTTSTVLGPEDAGYVAGSTNSTSKNRWPGQYFVNPSASYKVTDKITAFLNIDNVFDREPPALATNANVYDFLGRRYRLGVRANF